jgi:molecular chaperone Hsp33
VTERHHPEPEPERSPSGEPDRVGEATVRKYLDSEHDLMVVRADFSRLFAAYLDHVRRWEREPDAFSQVLMRQGLGAATLHLSCRPRGELVGWTIHVHNPATNVFLTGDSEERIVTGRIFTENVKASEESRMYVQTSRAGTHPVQSVVSVTGLDVLLFYEQYYEQSEQTPARFFEITNDEFVMLLGLPTTNLSWFRGLERDDVLRYVERPLNLVDEERYRFQCGCSSEKMLMVVRGLFQSEPEELFRGDDGVEVLCPRCGRRWWVDRAEFQESRPGDEQG